MRTSTTSTLIIIIIIIALAILGIATRRIPLPTITQAPITQQPVTATQTDPPTLTSGAGYDITGDIVIAGMNIDADRLNDFLGRRTGCGRGNEIYRYLVINGRLPRDFLNEAVQVLTPNLFAHEMAEMCVVFDLKVDSGKRRVKVKTGDFITTMAYYLTVRNSPGVVYRVGEPRPSTSAFYTTDTFPRHIAHVVGDSVVGTPYNFVPLPSFKQRSNAKVGDLNIPGINEMFAPRPRATMPVTPTRPTTPRRRVPRPAPTPQRQDPSSATDTESDRETVILDLPDEENTIEPNTANSGSPSVIE